MTALLERIMELHERCVCPYCARYRFDWRHVSFSWFGFCRG